MTAGQTRASEPLHRPDDNQAEPSTNVSECTEHEAWLNTGTYYLRHGWYAIVDRLASQSIDCRSAIIPGQSSVEVSRFLELNAMKLACSVDSDWSIFMAVQLSWRERPIRVYKTTTRWTVYIREVIQPCPHRQTFYITALCPSAQKDPMKVFFFCYFHDSFYLWALLTLYYSIVDRYLISLQSKNYQTRHI